VTDQQPDGAAGDTPRRDAAGGDKPAPEVYPRFDPWGAVSYLITGCLLWGLIGWLAGRWLHVPALAGLGLIIGGALGTWLIYLRYGKPQSGQSSGVSPSKPPAPAAPGASPQPHSRPPSDTEEEDQP
jgi:ATP synthase protein I